MTRLGTRLTSLFRTLFRKESIGRELDEELSTYLELLVEEKIEQGLEPAEARRLARQELGGREQVKAEVREQRIGAQLDMTLQDIGFAWRQLRRNPSFALVAVSILALGIGANTAVFSVVSQILLRGLPYADEDRVVTVWNGVEQGQLSLSENEYLAYRELEEFESFGLYVPGEVTLSGEGVPSRIPVVFASAEVLAAAGVVPVSGRPITAEDDRPGAAPVVMISEGMWQTRFGGAASAIGSDLILSGNPATIIGVLPAGFRLPTGFQQPVPDVLVPFQLDSPDPRNLHYAHGIAKLAPGVGLDRANAALHAAAQRVSQRLGTLPDPFTAMAVPAREQVVGSIRSTLWILAASVALVLVIACVNVANLSLARADVRVRELAVRRSLGAGRGRVVRQLLTEAGVLAVLGGLSGLVVGSLGARALAAAAPPGIPRLDQLALDPRVFGFCLVATAASAALIGLIPAFRAGGTPSADVLRGSRGSTGGASRARLRRLLVTGQVALAVMLTVAAGLLVRSYLELRAVDPGFDTERLMTFRLSLPASDYPDAASTRSVFADLRAELERLPGVESVGATRSLPLASSPGDWGIEIRGRERDEVRAEGSAPDWVIVSPGYFRTLGIPVEDGREFDQTDRMGTLPTVVISKRFADQHWPGGEALGAQLRMTTDLDSLWRTVVGVVGDVRHTSLAELPRPSMYLPHPQFPTTDSTARFGAMTFAVRTAGAAAGLLPAVREISGRLAPRVPVADIQTMEEVAADATGSQSFQGLLFTLFAIIALALVLAGIYGVMSYLVVRRSREIGIRLALGASPGEVRNVVLGEAATMVGAGVVVGLLAALLLSRVIESLLYGVTARDPVTFVGVPLLLVSMALLSSAIPALRASRVDPVETLRED